MRHARRTRLSRGVRQSGSDSPFRWIVYEIYLRKESAGDLIELECTLSVEPMCYGSAYGVFLDAWVREACNRKDAEESFMANCVSPSILLMHHDILPMSVDQGVVVSLFGEEDAQLDVCKAAALLLAPQSFVPCDEGPKMKPVGSKMRRIHGAEQRCNGYGAEWRREQALGSRRLEHLCAYQHPWFENTITSWWDPATREGLGPVLDAGCRHILLTDDTVVAWVLGQAGLRKRCLTPQFPDMVLPGAQWQTSADTSWWGGFLRVCEVRCMKYRMVCGGCENRRVGHVENINLALMKRFWASITKRFDKSVPVQVAIRDLKHGGLYPTLEALGCICAGKPLDARDDTSEEALPAVDIRSVWCRGIATKDEVFLIIMPVIANIHCFLHDGGWEPSDEHVQTWSVMADGSGLPLWFCRTSMCRLTTIVDESAAALACMFDIEGDRWNRGPCSDGGGRPGDGSRRRDFDSSGSVLSTTMTASPTSSDLSTASSSDSLATPTTTTATTTTHRNGGPHGHGGGNSESGALSDLSTKNGDPVDAIISQISHLHVDVFMRVLAGFDTRSVLTLFRRLSQDASRDEAPQLCPCDLSRLCVMMQFASAGATDFLDVAVVSMLLRRFFSGYLEDLAPVLADTAGVGSSSCAATGGGEGPGGEGEVLPAHFGPAVLAGEDCGDASTATTSIPLVYMHLSSSVHAFVGAIQYQCLNRVLCGTQWAVPVADAGHGIIFCRRLHGLLEHLTNGTGGGGGGGVSVPLVTMRLHTAREAHTAGVDVQTYDFVNVVAREVMGLSHVMCDDALFKTAGSLGARRVEWLLPAFYDCCDTRQAKGEQRCEKVGEVVVLGAYGGEHHHVGANVFERFLAIRRCLSLQLLGLSSWKAVFCNTTEHIEADDGSHPTGGARSVHATKGGVDEHKATGRGDTCGESACEQAGNTSCDIGRILAGAASVVFVVMQVPLLRCARYGSAMN